VIEYGYNYYIECSRVWHDILRLTGDKGWEYENEEDPPISRATWTGPSGQRYCAQWYRGYGNYYRLRSLGELLQALEATKGQP
jgi:hypothetical protein